jgi:hypothetical protein
MEYQGLAKVAGLWFYCLTCEKCGNKSVLECETQDFDKLQRKFNKKEPK